MRTARSEAVSVPRKSIRIGTRGSRLALAQAAWVEQALHASWPGLAVAIEVIVTSGDRLAGSLAQLGGKGLFVKEIEEALLDERIDCAVHSMKDLPVVLPAALGIAAVPHREDPRDVLIGPPGTTSVAALAASARIGTSSLRRRAQLLGIRPDLEIVELRGNVDTRLRKRAEGACDAVVLAAAGLARLGMTAHGGVALAPEVFVPAVAQGALALETRAAAADVWALLAALDHAPSRRAVVAERAFLAALGGDCVTPIAAYATDDGEERLALSGLVSNRDGSRAVRATASGPRAEAARLGADLAATLRARGAEAILAEVRRGGG
jgi:hydroxymethylbilane synthase